MTLSIFANPEWIYRTRYGDAVFALVSPEKNRWQGALHTSINKRPSFSPFWLLHWLVVRFQDVGKYRFAECL